MIHTGTTQAMQIRFLFVLACMLFAGESLAQVELKNHPSNSKLITADCSDTIGMEDEYEDITIICGQLLAPENYQTEANRLIKIPFLIAYRQDYLSVSNRYEH